MPGAEVLGKAFAEPLKSDMPNRRPTVNAMAPPAIAPGRRGRAHGYRADVEVGTRGQQCRADEHGVPRSRNAYALDPYDGEDKQIHGNRWDRLSIEATSMQKRRSVVVADVGYLQE